MQTPDDLAERLESLAARLDELQESCYACTCALERVRALINTNNNITSLYERSEYKDTSCKEVLNKNNSAWNAFAERCARDLTGIIANAYTARTGKVKATYGQLIRVGASLTNREDEPERRLATAVSSWNQWREQMQQTGQWQYVTEKNAYERFGRWIAERSTSQSIATL